MRLASRRRWLVPALVVAVLATACSGDDGGDDTATTSTLPPARSLVRVGAGDWPDCLNPLTCDADGTLRDQILRHVLPVAMEIGESGEPEPSPLLARAPTLDGDGADRGFTVTYHIDPDARWVDGRPITSSDFRATWLAVMATPEARKGVYADVTMIDDADPLVAVVELRRPRADWAELFGGTRGWLLQGDALGRDLDLTGRFRDDLPFSAGPFRLAAWDRDVAVLAAVDTYWDDARVPEVDQVRIERRDADRVEGFDIVIPAAGDDEPDGFEQVAVPTTEIIGIWFDQRSPLLQAKPHRDALAVAFDRVALAEELAGGRRTDLVTCLGWLPDVGPWCDPEDLPAGLFDPELARFALAVEGWVAGDDAILARNGERFSVTVTHDPNVAGTAAVADELVERFSDIGLAVSSGDIATADWRSDRDTDTSTGIGVFSYDLGVHPLVTGLYGCPRGVESSVVAWCPTDVVETTRAMVTLTDVDGLLDAARAVGDRAADQLIWIPLIQRHEPLFVRADRVALPDRASPMGGPLASLHDLQVRSG